MKHGQYEKITEAVMKILHEENAASDAETIEVLSKEAVIRAWKQFKQSARQSSVWKGKTRSRDSYPLVIYKDMTRLLVGSEKKGAEE